MRTIKPDILKAVVEMLWKKVPFRKIQTEYNISLNSLTRIKSMLDSKCINVHMSADEIYSIMYPASDTIYYYPKSLCEQAATFGLSAKQAYEFYLEQADNLHVPLKLLQYTKFSQFYKKYHDHCHVISPPPGVYGCITWLPQKGKTVNNDTGEIVDVYILMLYLPHSHMYHLRGFLHRDIDALIRAIVSIYTQIEACPRYLIPMKMGHTFRSGDVSNHERLEEVTAYYNQTVLWDDESVFKKSIAQEIKSIAEKLKLIDECTYDTLTYINILSEIFEHDPFLFESDFMRLRVYNERELIAMQSIPETRFVIKQKLKATVGIDFHVAVDGRFYSVPYKYAKQDVILEVTYNQIFIKLASDNALIATHYRLYDTKEKYSSKPEHMPPVDNNGYSAQDDYYLRTAAEKGVHVHALVKYIFTTRRCHPQAYRMIMSILRLGGGNDDLILDDACSNVLQFYKHINYYTIKDEMDRIKSSK